VINIEVFGDSATMRSIAVSLDELDGVSRVRVVEAIRPGHSVLSAAVRPRAVDGLLAMLRGLGVEEGGVTLTRVDVVGSLAKGRTEVSLVWADVLGTAWLNSRPVARCLAFMFIAGVIACYGVVDDNVILIVGAMAVSPDLLAITAIAVGLFGGRVALALRALLTLGLGLGLASAAAALFAFGQDRFGLIPSDFNLQQTGVTDTLISVSNETIAVALAAGIAGMLALETRASAGVGVAISVTTIPAAAYLGVAAGLGDSGEAWGALGVLAANVTMMVVGAVATLALQSALMRRRAPRRSERF